MNGNRFCTNGADFLLYGLVDLVIGQGFPVLEEFSQQLEDLEHQIPHSTINNTLAQIHIIKRELILLRRVLLPERDLINHLRGGDDPLVKKGTLVYLRDCYDHTIRTMDFLETYRDRSDSMLDIYLSSVNNRMNAYHAGTNSHIHYIHSTDFHHQCIWSEFRS